MKPRILSILLVAASLGAQTPNILSRDSRDYSGIAQSEQEVRFGHPHHSHKRFWTAVAIIGAAGFVTGWELSHQGPSRPKVVTTCYSTHALCVTTGLN